ncbi:coniferyl-aldehyde dehydrogenase family protein [Teladorsagia circumcincta]|uniref:Coniferyl-aldehyde dehydrogenase family protein n=1 Tax=Teladorsagia circumcincta TaxID=45464 RepID=A0A2G9TSC7_TELCI|nr:coniferyl-aldehyde dehydrogenase family protein [Teladorsagia circumcincta]
MEPTFEVTWALKELDEGLEHLEEWNASIKVAKPPTLDADKDEVMLVKEPLGMVLVIAPWNFPLLTSMPAVAALTGGNTVVLKLSEYAPTFSSVFAGLVAKYFDQGLFTAVEGAIPEATALLAERFDHIMYTGNPTVARAIMAAAAKNLTPVTLELGGKNPVLVEPDADIEDAARKIIVSKMLNCGQICVSSDYVLTTEEVKPKLVSALAKLFEEKAPFKENKEFSRIVNEKHFDRLSSLLKNTKGKILYQSKEEANRSEKFLGPYVVEIQNDDAMMQEEIFGPILPIVTVKSFDESVEWVRSHEKPLGAYLFTKDPEKARRFIVETSSGGVTVNDVMSHSFVETLPFGGVGNSGIGRIMKKYGFDNFVHEKPVLIRNGLGKGINGNL